MTWKTIRLDMARTKEFPEGSDAHAYLLHLPLDESGSIETKLLAHPDESPTVRRIWPGEHDKSGVVIRKNKGWAFSYSAGEADDEELFHLENHSIRTGEYLTITEEGGEKLPFRVAGISQ